MTKKITLTTPNPIYKPFRYPFAYDAWKKHEQMHWLSDEVPLAEDVKDWNTRLSKEEINLLTQIFRFFTQQDVLVGGAYVDKYMKVFQANEVRMMLMGFAARECFDQETEVLTENGWIKFPLLSKEVKVAQYDVITKAVEFVTPTDYVTKDFYGELHHYRNKTTDIMVTPGHRLIVTHPTSRKVEFKESREGLWGRNYLYPSTGYGVGCSNEVTTLERLLIAIQADGCVRSHCPSHGVIKKTIDISVKKQRKIDRVTSYLSELGLNCNPRIKADGMVKFTFTLPDEVDHLSIKDMGFINLPSLSSQKAVELIDEILFWDGSVYEYENGDTTKAYYNIREKAVDTVQAISSIAGISCMKGINRAAQTLQIYKNKHKSQTKTCYVLSFSNQVERTYPHRVDHIYDGKVYCVTVPSGAIVTRRNGRVAMSGNCVHQEAYANLLDTVGLPEVEYSTFFKYKEMKDKFDYAQQFNVDTPYETAKCMAVFSAFMEGLQLFSSFAILMNFTRFNKMKGMGQIVTWSLRDEAAHVDGMMMLFRTFIQENRHLWNDKLKKELYDIARQMVEHEDHFVDLAFEQGGIEGMTPEDIKLYVRYICDRRLIQLGLKAHYKVKTNPLPWLDDMLNSPEHVNFFEQRATDYSRAATEGTWEEAFADMDIEEDHYVVYGQVGCSQCVQAKNLLTLRSKSYEYIDLTDKTDEKMKLYEAHNARSMPIIMKNGEFFGGLFDLQRHFGSSQ